MRRARGWGLFVWSRKDGYKDLGFRYRKGECGFPYIEDMNNKGQILITHLNGESHLWENGKKRVLAPDNSKKMEIYSGINDKSELLGLMTIDCSYPTDELQPDPETGDMVPVWHIEIYYYIKLVDLKSGAEFIEEMSLPSDALFVDFNSKDLSLWRLHQNDDTMLWSRTAGKTLYLDLHPVCMNDLGQIVGYEMDGGKEHLVIMENGVRLGIVENTQPSRPFDKLLIYSINNNGVMAGCVLINEEPRAVILIPQ